MADTTNNAPDQQDDAAAGTPPSSGGASPGGSPGQQVDDWEAKAREYQKQLEQAQNRYAGQQAVLQEAQESRKDLAAELDSVKGNLQQLMHEIAETQGAKSSLAEQLEALQTEAQQLRARQQKMDMVREKFPTLLRFPLEALPNAEDPDGLESALSTFNEAVSSVIADATAAVKAAYTQGAVPTPPAAQQQGSSLGKTLEEATVRLNELAGTDKFDAGLAEYMKMLAAEPEDKEYRLREETLGTDPGLRGGLGTL